ncbi:Zinc finger MYM-type protein 1 [Merluccius polli]|uniref:Zinc finger MYM-type protein 1 n=1 Tax=Merluccius polli TaxID=89951 RepID=A0AA47MQX6_MERPO|nr:Zinc finger MYM-type protein 1 [Merluccius polli]
MSLTTLQEEVPHQEGQQDNPSQTEEELNTPEDILVSPYQPAAQLIEPQTLPNRTLRFQESWFKDYPWLHYSPAIKGVLCFYCVNAFKHNISTMARNAEQTISLGFRNWKKGREPFDKHTSSKAHIVAVNTHIHTNQSECNFAASQKVHKRQPVRYLARQGLALRGHENDEGNFKQHLEQKAESDPNLASWLLRNHAYTSPECQNELLQLMSNTIIRQIAKNIHSLPVLQYSLIMDGTQDISGTEQISICLRYVDADLEPQEDFVGLYEASSTTGENLFRIASDVLLRLNLLFSGLRGQTYDGAANMSGHLSGTQALIRRQQPLANFVHCGPHCVNLVTQATCTPVIRDALHWIHELGCLFAQSGKCKTIFKDIATSSTGSYTSIKPLCATRWTVHAPAIRAVLSQYNAILSALEEMASAKVTDNTAPRANGVLQRLEKGNAILGLLLGQELITRLEGLNLSLLARGKTISGMLKAVDYVRQGFLSLRTDAAFMAIYDKAVDFAADLDLQQIQPPHVQTPSSRYGGPAKHHTPATPEEYFRVQFFSAIDMATTQLHERFDQVSLGNLVKLEELLLTGNSNMVASLYPELDLQALQIQLAMFKANHTYASCKEAVQILRGMPPEVRGLFSQVETLVRLLLVVPVSSCEAERSFSALRRLKNWLRTTMTQLRLNSTAACHIHRDRLKALDKREIATAFIVTSERRVHVFGHF